MLFHENVHSERELVRRLPERLDWLWFLGYGLADESPHHSVLSKARARWGGELFEELFARTVRQCTEAGLGGGAKVHLDGSLIDADASRASVGKADAETIARIRAAYGAQEPKLDETKPLSARCETNLKLVSKTDPDAPCVSKGPQSGTARPRYKHHRTVDDRCGVITAVATTPGDVCPAGQTMTPRRFHERRQMTDCVADKKICTQCPLRAACTKSKTGRSVARHWREKDLEVALAFTRLPEAQADRRRRRSLMEGSFAPAANHDHCKRARWRRLHRQQIQDWINATVKNVARSAERRAQLSPPNSLNGPAKLRRRPRGRHFWREPAKRARASSNFRRFRIFRATCAPHNQNLSTAGCFRGNYPLGNRPFFHAPFWPLRTLSGRGRLQPSAGAWVLQPSAHEIRSDAAVLSAF